MPIIEVVQRVNVITHVLFYTNLYKHATCIVGIDCLKSQFSNIKFGLKTSSYDFNMNVCSGYNMINISLIQINKLLSSTVYKG